MNFYIRTDIFDTTYTRLGECYENGIGTSIDIKKAFECYEISAKYYLDGLESLGRCYRDGIYVEKDDEKAIDYFHQSIEGGRQDSYKELAILYMNKGEYSDAVNCLLKADVNTNSTCAIMLAECYLKGQGIEKNTYNAYQTLLNVLDHDPENKALIVLMKFIINHEMTLSFNEVETVFDKASMIETGYATFKTTFIKFKEFYKKCVIEKFIKPIEFDENDSYYRNSVYFYKDNMYYYFIDTETYKIQKARPVIIIDLEDEMMDYDIDVNLKVGMNLKYHLVGDSIHNLALPR